MRHDTTSNDLRRLHRVKVSRPVGAANLGAEMIEFFKKSVTKRQGKLAKLAEAWGQLVPENFSEHCALEGFSKGVLTVVVDSAPHLYEIKQLLLSSLERQLLLACKGAGLRKINLKMGRWYDGGDERRVRFDGK